MTEKEEYEKMSPSEKAKEDWMNKKWRPMMGWMYMVVCTTDFVIFPVLWSIIQTVGGGEVKSQWNPVTLQGAGLFHMAMGAVLGLAAWGRTQEKLNGAAMPGSLQPSSTTVTTTYKAPPVVSNNDMPMSMEKPMVKPPLKPPAIEPVRKPVLGPDDD